MNFSRPPSPEHYCAGEPTGIGGLELALVEGEIAGYAATNWEDRAKHLFAKRARYQKVVRMLKDGFRIASRAEESRATGHTDLPLRRCPARTPVRTQFLARRETARTLRHGPVPGTRLRPSC